MSNIINYNSWKNKYPFGAIQINQGVRVSVESNENYDLISIKWIILKDENKFVIEPNKQYGVIKSPGFMDSNRIVSKFIEYYYEKNGDSIKIKSGDYYLIGDEKVVLF